MGGREAGGGGRGGGCLLTFLFNGPVQQITLIPDGCLNGATAVP